MRVRVPPRPLTIGDNMPLRIIGDVHGYQRTYKKLAQQSKYSIQVGDVGFDYQELNDLDDGCHRIIGGNHDNYDDLSPHFLGDFGVHEVPLFGRIFFIRGELSVDKARRTPGRSWWPQEELNYRQASDCVSLYKEVKPDFVISHGCPESILEEFYTNDDKLHPSATSQLLEACYKIHAPRTWVFGHHHRNKVMVQENGSMFICLNELCYIDLNAKDLISEIKGQPISESLR